MSAEIPVAVIGIGCKFPGGSDNKELYYEFLRNKVRHSRNSRYLNPDVFCAKGDGMIEPPADRWSHAEWYGTCMYILGCNEI